jgi:hypothetical protein
VPVLVDGPGWCVMIGHDATVAYRSASRADAELVADCYRDTIAAALRDAVAEEREAIAAMVDETHAKYREAPYESSAETACIGIADAIRARGER